MTFEADLKSRLQSSGVSAVVDDRVFPLVRKQGSDLPAVTYQVVAGVPQQCLSGFTGALTQVRVQVDVWGSTPDEVFSLGALVQNAMLADSTTNGIRRATLNLFQDFFEDAPRIYRRLLDFNVWYRG
jgi:hypothetical protein